MFQQRRGCAEDFKSHASTSFATRAWVSPLSLLHAPDHRVRAEDRASRGRRRETVRQFPQGICSLCGHRRSVAIEATNELAKLRGLVLMHPVVEQDFGR